MAHTPAENSTSPDLFPEQTTKLSRWVKEFVKDTDRGLIVFYAREAPAGLQETYDAQTVLRIFQGYLTVENIGAAANFLSIPASLKEFFLSKKEALKNHFAKSWYMHSLSVLDSDLQKYIENIFSFFETVLTVMGEIEETGKTKPAIMEEIQTSVEAAGGEFTSFEQGETLAPPAEARNTAPDITNLLMLALEYARSSFSDFFQEKADNKTKQAIKNPAQTFEDFLKKNQNIPIPFLSFMAKTIAVWKKEFKEHITAYSFPGGNFEALKENERIMVEGIFALVISATKQYQTIDMTPGSRSLPNWPPPAPSIVTLPVPIAERKTMILPHRRAGISAITILSALAVFGVMKDNSPVAPHDQASLPRVSAPASPPRPRTPVSELLRVQLPVAPSPPISSATPVSPPMPEPSPTPTPALEEASPAQNQIPPAPTRHERQGEPPLPHKRGHVRNAPPHVLSPAPESSRQAPPEATPTPRPLAIRNIRIQRFDDGVFRMAYSASGAITNARFVRMLYRPSGDSYEVSGYIEAVCHGRPCRSNVFTANTGQAIAEISLRH